MKRHFIEINGTRVFDCGACPMNKGKTNPLWARLPPTHYCSAFIGDKPIFNPYGIPEWCPFNDTA